MSIITLTTDFGTKDYAVAAIKGQLFQGLKDVSIVDISHQITPFNIPETAFILKAAYPNFPKNTVHIIGVDSEKTSIHKHLIVKLNGHFFIGADNGIFSLLSESNQFEEIIEIYHHKSETSSFPTLDVFVDVAVKIINGTPLNSIGESIQNCKEWLLSKPNISKENELIGHIIYIDQLGNVVTDISKELFDRVVNNHDFEIIVSIVKINKIYLNYSALINYSLPPSQQQKPGKAMAIFNNLNLLEIALYKGDPHKGGSAANLLGLCVGDSIKITYNNK